MVWLSLDINYSKCQTTTYDSDNSSKKYDSDKNGITSYTILNNQLVKKIS